MHHNIVTEWQIVKEQLKELKERELDLRNQILTMHHSKLKPAGTSNLFSVDVGTGTAVKLKATTSLIAKPHPERYPTVYASQVMGNAASFDKAIVWKPALSKTLYKSLGQSERFELDQHLEIRQGQGQLSLDPEEGQ